MPILSLIAKLGLDGRGFQQGLNQAKQDAKNFSGQFGTTLGGLKGQIGRVFGVAALAAFTKAVVDTVGNIKDLSEQFTITTDDVQRLQSAFGKSMDENAWQKPLLAMNEFRKKIRDGDNDATKFARSFGLNLDEIKNPMVENIDVLDQFSKAVSGIELTQEQKAQFKEIFGLSGPKMVQAMKDYAGGKDEETELSPDVIENVDQSKKKLGRFWKKIKSAGAQVLSDGIDMFGLGDGSMVEKGKAAAQANPYTGYSDAQLQGLRGAAQGRVSELSKLDTNKINENGQYIWEGTEAQREALDIDKERLALLDEEIAKRKKLAGEKAAALDKQKTKEQVPINEALYNLERAQTENKIKRLEVYDKEAAKALKVKNLQKDISDLEGAADMLEIMGDPKSQLEATKMRTDAERKRGEIDELVKPEKINYSHSLTSNQQAGALFGAGSRLSMLVRNPDEKIASNTARANSLLETIARNTSNTRYTGENL
jgi:hypothetical protein